MTYEIKCHKNGLVLKAVDENLGVVYEESADDEFQAFANFLRLLTDHYGPQDHGRYSEQRIYVRVEPGDKWEPPKGKHKDYFCSKCGKYIRDDK